MANPRRCASSSRGARALDAELTAHFHNTRGQGLANVLAALEAGVRSFESSFGELGGCPVPQGRHRATSPPRTSSRCSTRWATRPASTSSGCWRRRARRSRCSAGRWAATCSPPGRSTGTETLRERRRGARRDRAQLGERGGAGLRRMGRRAACATRGAEDVRARDLPLPAQLRLGARAPLRGRHARRSRLPGGGRAPLVRARLQRPAAMAAARCCRGAGDERGGRLPAQGRRARTVVLVAHHDAAQTGLMWHPRLTGGGRRPRRGAAASRSSLGRSCRSWRSWPRRDAPARG